MANSFRFEGSIFLGAHDGKHARRLLWIGWIFRAAVHFDVVVIDLPEHGQTVLFESAEVVLAMRVVRSVELRECSDGFEHVSLCLLGKSVDAGGHKDFSALEGGAQGVIEFGNTGRALFAR